MKNFSFLCKRIQIIAAVIILCVVSIDLSYGAQDTAANDHSPKNYMVGYGSLINTKSRLRTTPNIKFVYPVQINDYERAWNVHGKSYKATFVGVIPKKGAHLNAVYYPISKEDLELTKKRELSYNITKLNSKNLEPLGLKTLPEGNYWISSVKPDLLSPPSETYPIIQSYIDIIVKGAFEIAERYQLPDYPDELIKTTRGWNKNYWINDRIQPRRPLEYEPDAIKIDDFLCKFFPYYRDIKISR
jgi:hypothetical protein